MKTETTAVPRQCVPVLRPKGNNESILHVTGMENDNTVLDSNEYGFDVHYAETRINLWIHNVNSAHGRLEAEFGTRNELSGSNLARRRS